MPAYVSLLYISVSGFYLVSYLVTAVLILRMRRYQPEKSTTINILVFLTSFLVKLLVEVAVFMQPKFFSTKLGQWTNVVEYLVTNAVVMNLYYFTYTMMSVWDTLEGKSPEDYKKKAKKTTIMFSVNVLLHAGLIICAAFLFLYYLPNEITKTGKCWDLYNFSGLDLKLTEPYLLYLFIFQCVVTLCEFFVIILFLHYFTYFYVKKLQAMRRAGQAVTCKTRAFLLWIGFLVFAYLC